MEIEKVYSILKTEKPVLEKWYYLMALGRHSMTAPQIIKTSYWFGRIMRQLPAMMQYNWHWDKCSIEKTDHCFLITAI